MSKLRVCCIGMSLDGYSAGPRQSLQNPLGEGGPDIMQWAINTKTMQAMFGKDGGSAGVDDDFVRRGFDNVGAWILGRSMFGPIRGPWPDDAWKGWWGAAPPYHCDTFVLTHYAREPVVMEGGTTFHFVTDGIEAALQRAKAAAGGKDVRLGGGAATIRQYLNAGLVDEMHIALSPVLLGSGEAIFADLDLRRLGYRCTGHVATDAATHLMLTKTASPPI